eukprot:2214579-Amphidinium_carterae.1
MEQIVNFMVVPYHESTVVIASSCVCDSYNCQKRPNHMDLKNHEACERQVGVNRFTQRSGVAPTWASGPLEQGEEHLSNKHGTPAVEHNLTLTDCWDAK